MALILFLETATSVCSVALAKDGKLISYKEKDEANIHASQLTLFIDEVMVEASLGYTDLDAVAVSKGPGSYTGLRIGVSTAKGLCYALDIPLISVNTLKAMAAGFLQDYAKADTELLCPMIDARRMEVYMAVFNNHLTTVEPVQAKILTENTFDEYSDILLFGDGAEKCRSFYGGKQNIRVLDLRNSARYLVNEAFAKYRENDFEDVAYFEPYYLKDFVSVKAQK